MDRVTIKEIVDAVTNDYEHKRIEEILSTQTRTGRTTPDDVDGLIGKAQACRDLRSLLYTAFQA